MYMRLADITVWHQSSCPLLCPPLSHFYFLLLAETQEKANKRTEPNTEICEEDTSVAVQVF